MDPVEKPGWHASLDLMPPLTHIPIDQHPDVSILTPTCRPVRKAWRDLVHIHDMRRARTNPEINEQVEVAIHKCLRDETVFFTDELVFHSTNAIQSQRRSWSNGSFIDVAGNVEKIQAHLETDEAARERVLTDMRAAPFHKGTGIFFHGIGTSRNYYHWMGEKFPRLALLEKLIDFDEVDHLFVGSDRELGFLQDSVDLFFPKLSGKIAYGAGFMASDACYSFASFLRLPDHDDRLDLGDAPDFHKSRVVWGSLTHLAEKYDADPERYAQAPAEPAPVIVISRRKAGGRQLTNFDALMDRLAPLGAREIFPEELSLREQIGLFRQARVVIAQHGAGMANLSFCREGATTAIEILHRRHAKRAYDFIKLSALRQLTHHVVIVDYDYDAEIDMIGDAPRRPTNRYDGDLTATDAALDRVATLVRDALDAAPT